MHQNASPDPCEEFDRERNDQIRRALPSKGASSFGIGCCVQPRCIFYGADRIRGQGPSRGLERRRERRKGRTERREERRS